MDLTEKEYAAKFRRWGADRIDVVAGEGVRIQHGTLANPVTDLLAACPAGKVWSVLISVDIEETDA